MRVRPSTRSVAAIIDFELASGEVVRQPVAATLQSRQWIIQAGIETAPGTGARRRLGAAGFAYGTVASATLQAAPQIGNHLLAIVGADKPLANVALSTTGWNLAAGGLTTPHCLNLWWKPVTDPSERSLTATVTAAYSVNVALLEYTNLAAAGMVDKVVVVQQPAEVTTLTIGPTGTLAQANELVLVVLDSIWGKGGAPDPEPSASGYELVAHNDQYKMDVFDAAPMSTDPVSAVLNWTYAHYANALLVTLKAATTAAGTRNPPQASAGFVEFAIAPDDPPALPSLPVAPTGLVATPGPSSVSLSWNGVPGATGFVVYQNGAPVHTITNYRVFTDSILALSSVTGAHFDGLAAGDYDYQVAATNRAGEGPRSSIESATVEAAGAVTVGVLDAAGVSQAVTSKVVNSSGVLVSLTGVEVR